MENQKKEIFLKVLNVEEDLNGMKNELSNLLGKYPQNSILKELKNQNEIFKKSEVIEKITQVYLNNLEKKYAKEEFEDILGKYNIELEKIKKWLNDTAKEYLKNNFKQEELRNYWFGSHKDMPVIIENGE